MMTDQSKLRALIARGYTVPTSGELRREGNVFFVGGDLPEWETLETLFESYCYSSAELFHLAFADINSFHNGEKLAGVIKKNFNAHVMGRLDFPAPSYLLERTYAAGVDIIDIPLTVFDQARSRERNLAMEERLKAIDSARSIFPKWSVVSTLMAGEEPSCSTVAGIDALLAREVVPLVVVSGRAAHYPTGEIDAIFSHLAKGWRKYKVTVKPLLPLIHLHSPFADAKPKGMLHGFIDKVQDRRLLATSDLRRILRVKQVEESFASAGL